MHRLYADPRTSVSDGGSSQTTLRSVSPVPTRSTSPRASPQRKHVKAPKAAKPSPRGPRCRAFCHTGCAFGEVKRFNPHVQPPTSVQVPPCPFLEPRVQSSPRRTHLQHDRLLGH